MSLLVRDKQLTRISNKTTLLKFYCFFLGVQYAITYCRHIPQAYKQRKNSNPSPSPASPELIPNHFSSWTGATRREQNTRIKTRFDFTVLSKIRRVESNYTGSANGGDFADGPLASETNRPEGLAFGSGGNLALIGRRKSGRFRAIFHGGCYALRRRAPPSPS